MANLNIAQLPVLSGVPSDDARFIVQQGSGTFQVTGEQLRTAYGGSGGGGGGIEAVQPGQGIAVDDTDPANPVVSALLEAGTNITLAAGTAPNSIRISATGGGGGGGGAVMYAQIAKLSPGATLTALEVSDAGATPFVITNQSNVDLNLDGLVGTYLVVFLAFGVPVTLTNPGGSNMFDKSGTALSVLSLTAYETIQLAVTGDGSNWSANVLARY